MALWTLLGIRHDPGDVFTLSRVLELPLVALVAVNRTVGLVATGEAEGVSAFALDVGDSALDIFNAVVAAGEWAPADALVIISIRFAVVLLISY